MTSDGKDLRGLEVAGVDSIYHPIHAVLRHRQIIITDTSNNLVGVRYGWNPFSNGNLVNEGRLPAPTFQINIKK
jgi:sialate O-acetylesterase